MRAISKLEFDTRIEALRLEPDVPSAVEYLAKRGIEVGYEALASFAQRNKALIEAAPGSAEQALRAILAKVERVERSDPGHFAMLTALGEVKAMAKRGLGAM